jgi:signal transduction histidine kinase
MSGWQFDPSVPALVHPIVHHPLPDEASREQSTERLDWLIIPLNVSVLRDQVLPSLAQRHFAGESGLEYEITVREGGPSKLLLYTSDPNASRKEPEVKMQIFGPPPEMGGGRPWMSTGGDRYLEARQWRSLSAPTWFPVIQFSASQPGWELLLSHREESLESTLEAIRRRNLFLSYGILLLLGASMSLILLASRRAHRLARLQMDFVATVSHELRTPLAVIQSAAENIRDGVIGGSEQINRYGQVIRNQTRQLSDLVEQILSFAAARDGKLRYRMEEISVADVVKTALGNTEDLIRQAGFTLEVEIADDLPHVLGDRLAIAQCLQNLIINAVKYGGERQWLRVKVVLANSSTGAREIQVQISDHGMGIRKSELAQIFEPFYRSTAVHEAQIHGTGLGLPMARAIAEAMNGWLSVESEVGVGSTFTLHLPAIDQRKIEAIQRTATASVHHE